MHSDLPNGFGGIMTLSAGLGCFGVLRLHQNPAPCIATKTDTGLTETVQGCTKAVRGLPILEYTTHAPYICEYATCSPYTPTCAVCTCLCSAYALSGTDVCCAAPGPTATRLRGL
eukprot:1440190-Rhodomonas_salina.1